MARLAEQLEGAVLDNFWYRQTASELLAPLASRRIVEVFCRCDPQLALRRFRRFRTSRTELTRWYLQRVDR